MTVPCCGTEPECECLDLTGFGDTSDGDFNFKLVRG